MILLLALSQLLMECFEEVGAVVAVLCTQIMACVCFKVITAAATLGRGDTHPRESLCTKVASPFPKKLHSNEDPEHFNSPGWCVGYQGCVQRGLGRVLVLVLMLVGVLVLE